MNFKRLIGADFLPNLINKVRILLGLDLHVVGRYGVPEGLGQEEGVVVDVGVVHVRRDVARNELGLQLFNGHLYKKN